MNMAKDNRIMETESMEIESLSKNKYTNPLVSSLVASLLVINSIFFLPNIDHVVNFDAFNSNTQSWTLGGRANADSSRVVGEISGSGLVFKDTLNIESFDDPKVKGVTLYLSNFQKPLSERLGKDFFSDPSSTALTCAKTGPISIADNIRVGKDGEEVFEESKSLLFKTLRVKRIYDKEKNTVIYVSYNTRIDKGDDSNKSRFKSSLCAVGLESYGLTTPTPAPTPAASN